MKIVQFRRQSDSVIALLQGVMDDAKDGHVVAIAICGITDDRLMFNDWFDGNRWLELVGAVEVTKHDMIAEAAERVK